MAFKYGGCACGQVRYELRSEPSDTGYCHCRICQRVSGAPVLVFTSVPVTDFVVTSGAEVVRSYPSTSAGWRQFCSVCGTQLAMQVTHEPATIDVTVASLDEPATVPPTYHIFEASRIPWFATADTLPRHAAIRPRGA
jgi:hypothetical protein